MLSHSYQYTHNLKFHEVFKKIRNISEAHRYFLLGLLGVFFELSLLHGRVGDFMHHAGNT